MKWFVIVKTGEKIAALADVAGDYEDWIAKGMDITAYPIAVVDVAHGQSLPALSEVAAIVVTGSAAMVTDDSEWMAELALWLRRAVAQQVPLLGICFGHQLLAKALGGDVDYNPRGLEVGTASIHLASQTQADPLFSAMPEAFSAQVSHRQSVLRLPAGARLLASSEKDPHQAFRYGTLAWGVQFHPEFDASIARAFIEHYRRRLQDEGASVEHLLAEVSESPQSASLLKHFARLAVAANAD